MHAVDVKWIVNDIIARAKCEWSDGLGTASLVVLEGTQAKQVHDVTTMCSLIIYYTASAQATSKAETKSM